MAYDFDSIVDRRGTYSLKWDVANNELPMWVADMDFKTAPEIVDAIKRRVDNGIFGYSIVPEEWALSYISWWKKYHNCELNKDWLIFTTGVVPAISSCVRKLTTPAENVLIMTPVYNIFFNSIVNNGRNVLECPLSYKNGEYDIDFAELESKLSNPQTSLMILCNPHNPVGKIWDRETLARIGDLCYKHHVTVISDEIHCDITDPGCEYVPFISASEVCKKISVNLIAPTKAFNIAGLNSAAAVVYDEALRHKVWRGLNTDEVAEPNAFAMDATIAAFEKGRPWLDELRQYVYDNKMYVSDYIKNNIPKLKLISSKATYLLWIDVSEVTTDGDKLAHFIRESTGLYVCEGSEYGKCGSSFIRVNIACPRSVVEEGMQRLNQAIELFINK